jgi:hypothetical protein
VADGGRLANDDRDAILYAPFDVYATVASADGPPSAAQFRRMSDEIESARATFAHDTVGRTMMTTLARDLEPLWAAYHESARPARDGLKRAAKALRQVPDDEAIAMRDWLIVLAVRIAESNRMVGGAMISAAEAAAIRDVAGWLDRPVPEGLLD